MMILATVCCLQSLSRHARGATRTLGTRQLWEFVFQRRLFLFAMELLFLQPRSRLLLLGTGWRPHLETHHRRVIVYFAGVLFVLANSSCASSGLTSLAHLWLSDVIERVAALCQCPCCEIVAWKRVREYATNLVRRHWRVSVLFIIGYLGWRFHRPQECF